MPISPQQRDRLERSLILHEYALQADEKSPMVTLHRTLLELGRDDAVIALVNDFVDSPALVEKLRVDVAAILQAYGITLPQGVTVRVVDSAQRPPILHFEVTVQDLTVLIDWDPELGLSTQAARSANEHQDSDIVASTPK